MTLALTQTEVAELLDDLHALRDSLEGLLVATEAGEAPIQLKDNKGRLTRMDDMHNQSILKANRNLTKNRLQQVIRALNRVEADHYGLCSVCDEPIGFPRLKAYPEASMCIACKSAGE
ncbi:MAG: TraR/DksA family transcriptional regulator [Proteobacteria bacterium]|jgi:DnaK suppressor protein|nr:TraR/DksA family transcriptional regulator [Pseudomonadota bacterium]